MKLYHNRMAKRTPSVRRAENVFVQGPSRRGVEGLIRIKGRGAHVVKGGL
jgi:hypothetical protein